MPGNGGEAFSRVFPYHVGMSGPEISRQPFRAELVPHRSLSPKGFTIIMVLVAILSFVGGAVFFYIGAWPVIGFIGLDVALIYWAFQLSFRDSERREIVEVGDRDVTVTRMTPGRQDERLAFQRTWLRIELEEDSERELIGALRLKEGDRSCEVGSFLSPQDRKQFCKALEKAVINVRI